MNHVLAPSNVEVLAQFAWSKVLLAFDFDGTLAPIVGNRDAARMRASTRELLSRVCRLYPCAVISGRGHDDVRARLEHVPVLHVVGNHGLEPGERTEAYAHQMLVIRPLLERALAGVAGVDIEDKRYSLAIHYRRARRKSEARKAIEEAVSALPLPTRVIPGKLVVNLLPADAPHKGDALVHLREEERADTAIYVGDDITDEDVFELDQPGRLLTIRVGRSDASAASYYLHDQREIDLFLSRIVALRAKRQVS